MAQASTTAGSQPPTDSRLSAHYRKVELQSHADLTYLQQNLAKSARQRLDLHFPPAAALRATAPAEVIPLDGAPAPTQTSTQQAAGVEEEDPLRARVRDLVDSFLQDTFQSAAHSISINGIDASTLAPSNVPSCTNPIPSRERNAEPLVSSREVEGVHYTYSAFDPQLQKKVALLHGELESLTAQVSKLRRQAPKSAAEAYKAQLDAALTKDDEGWDAQQSRLQEEKHRGLELDKMRDGWNDDIQDVYGRGVRDLAILSGVVQKPEGAGNVASLTETVGKARRAANVAQEFE